MSLLNDALRKKNREGKMPGASPPFLSDPKGRKGDEKKRKALMILILMSPIMAVGLWVFIPLTLHMKKEAPLRDPAIEEKQLQRENAVDKTRFQPASLSPLTDETTTAPDPVVSPIEPEKDTPTNNGAFSMGKSSERSHGVSPPDPTLMTVSATGAKKDHLMTEPENFIEPAYPEKRSAAAGKNLPPSAGMPEQGHDTKSSYISTSMTAEPFYQKASRYHHQGNLKDAINMYLEVLKKNPEHTDAMLGLASAYIEASAYSAARPYLNKLYNRYPKNGAILLNLAVAEIGLGQNEKALTYLKEAENLESGTSPFDIFVYKGIALSRLSQYGDAITWFKRAEDLHADHPHLLFNMAIAYDKNQQYLEARKYYETYLKMAGEIPESEQRAVENRIRIINRYLTEP